MSLIDLAATNETKALYQNLVDSQGNHIYFGQERPFTKVSGNGGNNAPDCFKITGKYPYVYGTDYDSSIENASFASEVYQLKKHYRNGGFVTLCWHMENWVTGGDSRDLTGSTTVNILPGGTHRTQYLAALDQFAQDMLDFKDDCGRHIPVLFRPFHEGNLSAFWWGTPTTSNSNYVLLFQDIVTYLRDTKGVHNLIYIYCQSTDGGTFFGVRYPGDSYLDIISADIYALTINTSPDLARAQTMSDEAVSRGKVFAMTEGVRDIENNADSTFWTTNFMDMILADSKLSKMSYASMWVTKPWGPEYGRSDDASFLTMSNYPEVLFLTYREESSLTYEKKFPFDLMQCVEAVDSGSALRVVGDTFWQQRIAYHSASAGANGQVEYLGLARPGAGISSSAWAIKRISYDASGNASAIQWSGASLNINKVWDDRATYTYG